MNDITKSIMERYGFPALVALALGWFLRHDVVLPLIDSHRETLRGITETQREISRAIEEQTRLLYALQPHTGKTALAPRDLPGENL